MEKRRCIGIDLLRILSMLMVVILHIIGQGGILTNAIGVNKVIIKGIQITCMVAVNIFAIISGWGLCEKEYKKERIIKIIKNVFIINLIILFILTILFRVSILQFIIEFYISLSTTYWYITDYIAVIFLTPYLNIFIKSMKKEELRNLLLVMYFMLSIIPTIIAKDIFHTNQGYSLIWMIYLYLIGSYLKKYPIIIEKKKILIFICFSNITVIILYLFMKNINLYFFDNLAIMIISYTSPFILFNALAFFIFFSNINKKKVEKGLLLKALSNSSFFVYVVHCNGYIFNFILKDYFIFVLKYNILIQIILIVMFSICIYINIVIMHIMFIYFSKFIKRIY